MDEPWLYQINFGVLFAAFLLIIMVAGYVGRVAGSRESAGRPKDAEAPSLNGLDNTVLGLLALMIGFTMAVALSRYDGRRQAAVSEANAIGTAWLRSQMLPEPYRGETDRLMRAYVQARLDIMKHRGDAAVISDRISRSGDLQSALWAKAREVTAALPQPVPTGQYVAALNDLIDEQEVHLSAARTHVPSSVFLLLAGVASVAAAFMNYAAAIRSERWRVAETVVLLLFVSVIMTIYDLDNPAGGFIRVSWQPYLDLAASMGMPPG